MKMPQETQLSTKQLRKDIPDFRVGDTVKVLEKIKEGDKDRLATFTGLVTARKHGVGINATFAVRAEVAGVGMEKTFPLHSPFIDKIEPVKRSKVRRAKLYYLRREIDKKRRRFETVKHEFVSNEPVPSTSSGQDVEVKAAATEPAKEAAPVEEKKA